MSWKSFLSVGLLCVLASPALAVDPNVQVIKGGTEASGFLNAAGNWVWVVQVTPSNPLPDVDGAGGADPSTPLAAELGFTETSNSAVISAARLNQVTNFDRANPGNIYFPSWQTGNVTSGGMLTEVDPVDRPGQLFPVGLMLQCPTCANVDGVSRTGAGDQVYAALGSVDFTSTGYKDLITIEVQGPCVGNGGSCTGSPRLTTGIQVGGIFNTNHTTGGVNGRVAELNPDFDPEQPEGPGNRKSLNYDLFGGASYLFQPDFDPGAGVNNNVKAGDANLDNSVGFADFNLWFDHFGGGSTRWQDGDWNDDESVGFADFNIWFDNFGSGAGAGDGSGSGANAAPEPATVVLIGLGTLLLAGLRLRKR